MYSEEPAALLPADILYLASNWVKKSHVFLGAKGVEEPWSTWEGLWSPLSLVSAMSQRGSRGLRTGE